MSFMDGVRAGMRESASADTGVVDAQEQGARNIPAQDETQTATDTSREKTTNNDDPEARAEVIEMQEQAPLLQLIQSDTGEDGKESGNAIYFKKCPICHHKDCFRYYPNSNTWACFGASNPNKNANGREGGAYLAYLMRAHNMTSTEAMKKLREVTNHPYKDRAGKAERAGVGRPGAKADNSGSDDVWRDWEGNPINRGSSTNATGGTNTPPTNDNNESVIDFEDVGDILGTPYEIVPPIIDGLLDVGDVIVISGDAGVGKSWMLLSLGFAVATGGEFMGMRCTRGRVCYVNPEIQSKKFRNRLRKYANTTGIIALDRESFEILNCRGTVPDVQGVRDKLKSQAGEFSIVLLDSIYMLNNANENDAQEMKQLFFEILGICQEKHTAVAFTHHNGKGATSKSVQDRMRGSSVFSGAPDVCLAVTKLYPREGEHDGAIELLRTYDKRGDDGETVPAEALILRSTKVRDHAPMKNRYLIWQFPRFIEDVTGELEAALLQPKEQQTSTKEDENRALVAIVRELIEDGKPTDAESVMVRFNDWIRENIDPDKTKGADTVKRYCREGKYTGVTWDKQAKRFTIPTPTDDD